MLVSINTLYIKSITAPWIDISQTLKRDFGLSPLCWISNNSSLEVEAVKNFPKTRIIQHFDVLRLKVPDWFDPESPSVDATFLKANAEFEDIFYNMMDRWCGGVKFIAMEKRRSYYIDMANYLITLYKTLNIECVIIPTVPHRLYDYMAFVVAQYLNIPFIILDQTNELIINEEGDKCILTLVHGDPRDPCAPIRSVPKRKRNPSPALQRYIDSMGFDYERAKPNYFKEKDKKKSFSVKFKQAFRSHIPFTLRLPFQLLKHVLIHKNFYVYKLTFPYRKHIKQDCVQFQKIWDAMIEYENVRKRSVNALKWYEARSRYPNFDEKYIYFAPHFQPERSSTPDCDLCQWTELMIEMLMATKPNGWKLYLKEHPSNYRYPIRSDNNRSVALYENLKSFGDDLVFIDIQTDPFELIDKAQCIATGRGTTALQAILRGKPAAIFGQVWFRDAPGISYIQSLEACQEFFRDVQNGMKPDHDAIIQYLCSVEVCAKDYRWARGKTLYCSEKHKGSLEGLCKEIFNVYTQYHNKNLKRSS